jgi:hypothetical protein
MKSSKEVSQFTREETQLRFEAALRGARIAGPQHKERANPKSKQQRKRGKKK